MSISREKKEFIKKTAPGIHVYTSTYGVGEPIMDIVSRVEGGRYSFSQKKFCKAVDTLDDDTLRELLEYFDNNDMCLCDVFVEACIPAEDLNDNERKYADIIMEGNLVTFSDFLDR